MQTKQDIETVIAQLGVGIASLFPRDKIEAILFGSYARGDADADSDIDVLFLVDASRQEISVCNWQVGELAADLLIEHGILVSPIVENRNYFNANSDVLPFFRNIVREGVKMSA